MNIKKLQVWLPLIFALVMIMGMMIGYNLHKITGTANDFSKINKNSPLAQVLELINNRYVDAINTDTYGSNAIKQVVSKLDPQSMYILPVNVNAWKEDLQGEFNGSGVDFYIFNDTANIINVVENGPGEKAGLQIGDQILQISDSLITENAVSSEGIKRLLRDPAASTVEVRVLRGRQEMSFTINRGNIPLSSVDAAYMIDNEVGIIRLNTFSPITYEQFMKALEDLQSKGLKNLILDLRGNTDGILNEAVDIADEFLDENKLIVYTQGNKIEKQEYRCKRPGLFEKGKMVVLIDDSTASASEVLAGALQDWDRATIIGKRTSGKGLVQEEYELTDGSALRLTVARYYTPSGRSIQKSYKGNGNYRDEVLDMYDQGKIGFADSNKIQFGKAYKTKSGRTIYSGLGIMPDIFVPSETSTFSKALNGLYFSPTLKNFASTYYIQHKAEFKKYPSVQQFASDFNLEDTLWNDLVTFAAKDNIKFPFVFATEKEILLRRVKALLARQLWKNEGFYKVSNFSDPVVKRALMEINN